MATITFNANGCSGTMASETETLNSYSALSSNTFSCAGYNFNDWNTAVNGSGVSYANDALYVFAASATLYAQWSATPTSIPFSGTNSSNWSGYVFRAPAIITYASGRWTVPTMNCAGTPNGDSATWVGIGGAGGSSGALLQTGTSDNCVNGAQEDSGWWEIVPANPNSEETYLNFTVNPGDQIVAEVYQNSGGQWETVLQDLTSGLQGVMQTGGSWYVSTIATNTLIGGVQGDASGYQYVGGYSAEWITEDPSGSTSGAFYPFANYGSVTFTNLETNVSPWSLPNSDAFEMVQNGVTLSVPGTVSGSGFTVSYTGP